MESFAGKIAVVTGGGTGMGRELVGQLAAEGCHVAMCDVNPDAMAESAKLALEGAPEGTRVTTFVADVSDEAQMQAFAAAVGEEHATDHIHVLFNNAGIGGGGSVFDARDEWERTFNICWGGVLNGVRVFLPMLVAADEGHIVNTSSVNGLWASIGPNRPHTAYSAAKFAVRGFTEALITDLRVNAPHVTAHVVHPGHIGTEIVSNSAAVLGGDDATRAQRIREQAKRSGMDLDAVADEDVLRGMQAMADLFRTAAPTSAAEAATIILDGVKAAQWRILVGQDAVVLDEEVRADGFDIYEPSFYERLAKRGAFGALGPV
jgi:NAD(P)-dependent dehydrogenase (short-subunit alcohol dehydrogenase family)